MVKINKTVQKKKIVIDYHNRLIIKINTTVIKKIGSIKTSKSLLTNEFKNSDNKKKSSISDNHNKNNK